MKRTIIAASIFLVAVTMAPLAQSQEPRIVTNFLLNSEQWDTFSGAEQERIENELREARVWGNNVHITGDPMTSPFPESMQAIDIVGFFEDAARVGCVQAFELDLCHYGQGSYSRGARLNGQTCTCNDSGCGWD